MENKHRENDDDAGEVLKDIQLENLLDNFRSNGVDLKFIISLDKADLKDCLGEVGINSSTERHRITERVLAE